MLGQQFCGKGSSHTGCKFVNIILYIIWGSMLRLITKNPREDYPTFLRNLKTYLWLS